VLAARATDTPLELAIAVGSAAELIHTATLYHDDVVDDGRVRRGRPAARMVFGNGIVVLVGDFCLARALDTVASTGQLPVVKSLAATVTIGIPGFLLALAPSSGPVEREGFLRRLARFYYAESCGQCTPCREGTGWLYRVLTRITQGQGTAADLDMLVDVANKIEGHTICALGDAAAWPVQSFLKHFRHEFEYMVEHRGRSIVDALNSVAA